jgi:hypothetical protein
MTLFRVLLRGVLGLSIVVGVVALGWTPVTKIAEVVIALGVSAQTDADEQWNDHAERAIRHKVEVARDICRRLGAHSFTVGIQQHTNGAELPTFSCQLSTSLTAEMP